MPDLAGRWVSIKHNVAWAEAYFRTKWHPEPDPSTPAVWPQYTKVTDRQDRQRSDSIGRTVLQTVAQKASVVSYSSRNRAYYTSLLEHTVAGATEHATNFDDV